MKRIFVLIVFLFVLFPSAVSAAPLRVNPDNPRYFTDGTIVNGKLKSIYLTGTHTWRDFLAFGSDNFNFVSYLNFLKSNNLNYMRLWTWEDIQNIDGWAGKKVTPLPYTRPGPGNAADGLLKMDLTQFNQVYFDRMRQKVIEARDQGIFVDIQLFNGWSVGSKNGGVNPWSNHPFNSNNNINGINADTNRDGQGYEFNTVNSAFTSLQDAYVKKIIDTVNDLDNVLYEIANETQRGAQWQNHMIDLIHSYEAGKPKQHPVGFSVEYPSGNNNDLFSSNAEWVSPNDGGGYMSNPPANTGSKVITSDTDHLWGLGGDRVWVWKSFNRGLNTSYMDCYTEDSNGCPISQSDPNRVGLLKSEGYARTYAEKMNLTAMPPQGSLTSTSYALANTTSSPYEFLVYNPSGGSFTVNLASTPGNFSVEWFNPSNGQTTSGASVSGGAS